ncbi:hypothetical protein GRX03_15160 [Halovenus sp. WSH3]|uniref:PGF-CTERM sorting domain-containing protein n=1 Tax=Halovenus carboxidivorans TaxID=2692199 RepID=A0A6B0T7L6_9EURY|nr:Hvo_1808 family surface protein [Halovenus carboxidivorans]MXR52937.1 hypothetical protein [Halovenus carboxidivorans]
MRRDGTRLLLFAIALVAFGVVIVTPAAASPGETTDSTASAQSAVFTDDHVGECAATPPSDLDDPENPEGVIGWVEGYWYTEPVEVTPEDGFNETERDRLAGRTAAQVEALRCLDYTEGLPPLRTISREEYRERIVAPAVEQISPEGRLYERAQYAARLTIGNEVNTTRELIEAQTAFPAAFYLPSEQYMAFVTDDETVEDLNQGTLAHELVHALQDQHFDVAAVFAEPTNDGYLSSAGVVETDAQFFQQQYQQNCAAGEWATECFIPAPGQPPEVPNWAIALNQQFQYTLPLIEQRYQAGGTQAINDLFGNYPETTTETIYPDRLGEFETANITVPDRSTSAWRRVQSGNLTYNTIGQAGVTAILVAPYYETNGRQSVISDFSEFMPRRGELDYGIPETDGWRGDKLYGYANGDNETAAVWELAWADAGDAEQFAEAYRSLLEYRGGTLADGYQNVYTLDTDAYDMAVAVEQTDDRVRIVTAPSVDDLTTVHESISLQQTNGSQDSMDGTDSEDGSDGTEANESDNAQDSDGSGAGFGLFAAALAVIAVGAASALRRR